MVIYIGMRNDSVRAEVLSWHDLKQSVRRLALRSIEKFQQSYICDYMHVYRVACIKFCCHAEFLGWHDLKQSVRRRALRRRQSLLYVTTCEKKYNFETITQNLFSFRELRETHALTI